MPRYVDHDLIRFKHDTPRRAQDQPYQHTFPTYGARQQFVVAPDGTALLDKEVKTIAASDRHFPVLFKISRQHHVSGIKRNSVGTSKPNREYHEKVMIFLDYSASQEEVVVMYHASNMVLACHSDASYLT